MGVYYLSTEEGQRRIGGYCENIVAFGKAFDQYCDSLTAKDIAKATGHILGDVAFLNGVSAVGTFLKEIDALGKISSKAKVIIQGLKSAIEEHPAFETVEGIVLKMSEEVKDGSKINKTITDISKSGGRLMQERGKVFEDFLVKQLGGRGSFKAGGREFDGAIGNIWYEAKSGKYWEMLLLSEKKLARFKTTTCDCLKIAKDNSALFEIHSNSPIPQNIKDWLIKKQVPFTEWL